MDEMPSFFKVLIRNDFTRQLRLPPAFLQDCDSAVPEKVKLRISLGRTWNVKVEETRKGLLCFTRGWQNFAADLGLRLGEFLIFTFDCDRTFRVSVYQTNACVKNFTRNTRDSDPEQDGSEAPINGGASKLDQSSSLYFIIELKKHHLLRLYADEHGCGSVVKLDNARRPCFRIEMTRGWRQFLKANGIVVGKTYSFEFMPIRNVIQVKEVKKGK